MRNGVCSVVRCARFLIRRGRSRVEKGLAWNLNENSYINFQPYPT